MTLTSLRCIAAVTVMMVVMSACGSSGPDDVAAPNVVGDSQSAATAAITAAGLTVGTITTQSSSSVAAGVVISQSPAAGATLGAGTAVGLIVSSGPAKVAAPNVVHDTQSAAIAALTAAGLKLGTVTMQSNATVTSGEVISETPGAGTSVAVGSAVNLVVSTGLTFSGVVASGYAVANNAGYALDAVTGTQIPFVTDSDGNYNVDVFGYAGPFLLHVLGTSAGGSAVNLYSLAAASSAGTTINVTPLSDLILGYAAGVTTSNLEATCTGNLPACPALLKGILASLTTANASVVKAIPASVWAGFGITPATFDAITSQFATTHAGVDGLLDALSILPPVTTGGSYTISLLDGSSTLLATVPTSGTAGTEGAAPTPGSNPPTAAAVTQATNLAAVEGEIQAFFVNFTALYADSALPPAAQIEALLAPNFLEDGQNASAWATTSAGRYVGATITGGAAAPYSSGQITAAVSSALPTTPGPAVVYDANNCVTSIWVYTSASVVAQQLVDTIPAGNAAGTCTGGKWLLAGDDRSYESDLRGHFSRTQLQMGSATGATYSTTFGLNTDSNQTTDNAGATAPYALVVVAGPGITTVGAPTAAGGYLALIPAPIPTAPGVPNSSNALADFTTLTLDPYYGGSSALKSCTSILTGSNTAYTSATPCFNSSVTAGSDYDVAFFDSSGALLAQQWQRMNLSLSSITVPIAYYPTVTSATPASSSIPTGASSTTVSVHWTEPAGNTAYNDIGMYLYSGASLAIFSADNTISPTSTTTTFSVTGLTVAPAGGLVGISTIVGGLTVGSSVPF